jgi:hypothetical protein
MTGSTQILAFCTTAAGSGGNRLTPSAYAALTSLLALGFTSGLAQSVQVNTVLAQTSLMSAAVANFISGQGGTQNDDGNVSAAVTNFENALTNYISGSLIRQKLTNNTSYYIATTGNDSTGDGSMGNPWLTAQHAVNYILANVDLSVFAVSVNFATGTYAGWNITFPWTGGNNVRFIGDTTTPANVTINSTVTVANGGFMYYEGFNFAAGSNGNNILAYQGGTAISIGNVNFGSCVGVDLDCGPGGYLVMGHSYTHSGTKLVHYDPNGGTINVNSGITVTAVGTPNYTNQFAQMVGDSSLIVAGVSFPGAVIGQKFFVGYGGNIQTGTAGNLTYLPGSIAGQIAVGGTYDNIFGNGAASLGASGYQIISNGTATPLILQWGTTGAYASGSPIGSVSVTFPITFPNAVVSTNAFPVNPVASGVQGAASGYTALSTSGVTYQLDTRQAGVNLGTGVTAKWFALGY